MKLETKLKKMIPAGLANSIFSVIAYELTHDGQGWSVNTPFQILSAGSYGEMLETVRGRWEAFKANYASKARVSDIQDIEDFDELSNELEVNCMAFVRVTRADF